MDAVTELVERSREGDSRAFAEIVTLFQDRAVAYAAAQLSGAGSVDRAAARAFQGAWVALPRLEEPRGFTRWFRRRLFRRCRRIRGGGAVRPWSTALELAALPPKLRMALFLHHAGDLSLLEMAAFLEVPVRAIRRRLVYVRRALDTDTLERTATTLRAGRPSADGRFVAGVMARIAGAERQHPSVSFNPIDFAMPRREAP